MLITRHNEADEPFATQPLRYREIKSMLTTRDKYAAKLEKTCITEPGYADQKIEEYRQLLDAGSSVTPRIKPENNVDNPNAVDWAPYLGREWDEPADTSISLDALKSLASRLQDLPGGFELHPRVQKIVDDRRKMAAGALAIDWGCAGTLISVVMFFQPQRLRNQFGLLCNV